MKHSKKTLCLVLACVLLLGSLAGCAGEAPTPNTPNAGTQGNPDNGSNTNSDTNGTTNSEPTEEENSMILEYINIVRILDAYASADYANPITYEYKDEDGKEIELRDSLALAHYYEVLSGMGAIDKWLQNTEYMQKHYGEVSDRQTVLAKFTVIENVLLGIVGTESDVLGNKKNVRWSTVYDTDGRFLGVGDYNYKFYGNYGESMDNGPLANLLAYGRALTWGSGDGVVHKLQWALNWCRVYDDTGRVVKMVQGNRRADGQLGADSRITAAITFTYNDKNQCITATYTDGSETTTMNFTYDENGNALGVQEQNSRYSYQYKATYDAQGNLTSEVYGRYDAGTQYYEAKFSTTFTADYTYDSNGKLEKMVTMTYSSTADDGTRSEYTFQYDAQGNRTAVTYTEEDKLDSSGNVKTPGYTGEGQFLYGNYYHYGK